VSSPQLNVGHILHCMGVYLVGFGEPGLAFIDYRCRCSVYIFGQHLTPGPTFSSDVVLVNLTLVSYILNIISSFIILDFLVSCSLLRTIIKGDLGIRIEPYLHGARNPIPWSFA